MSAVVSPRPGSRAQVSDACDILVEADCHPEESVRNWGSILLIRALPLFRHDGHVMYACPGRNFTRAVTGGEASLVPFSRQSHCCPIITRQNHSSGGRRLYEDA